MGDERVVNVRSAASWRRPLLLVIAVVIAVTTLGALSTSASGQPRAIAPRTASVEAGAPNILIINTDDQRTPGTLDVMPKVQRLFAQAGTSYSNGMVSTPLCCPSRSSLFAGRYSHNTGVLGNGMPDAVQAFDQDATIQGYLQDAGYRTAMAGKFLTTYPLMSNPKNFDHWAHTTGGYKNVPFNVDGTYMKPAGYYSNHLATYSKEFLTDFESTDDQPWMLYVAPQAPHWNYTPSAKYKDAPLPPDVRSPSWNEADVSDKPPWVRWYDNESEGAYNVRRDAQLRTLMSVDDMVGSIFKQMNTLDETRDTLAIFMSDNGYMWGDHNLEGKRHPYVESTEVPFIVRWPGHVAPAVTSTQLVLQVDVLPTLLEAAALTPTLTYPLDGKSLLSSTPRTEAYLEYHKSNDSGLRPWASLRGETWQYVEWYEVDTGVRSFREYYDLTTDPYQLVNILRDGDPTNDPALAPLHAQLDAARTCSGVTCP